jgi:hypothetical protein
MAYVFTVNQSPATGSLAMWNFVAALIAQGWTKLADSDGTTYSNVGTQVTGGNAGAHGLGNQYAWVVLRDPSGAGGREYCIQNTFSNNLYWRIKYSQSAGFVGGAPSATQVPSATDETVPFGSGTDAEVVWDLPTSTWY